MKKALTITLNRTVFYIEEDGYERLRRYLDSIAELFADSAERDEIIADIESRIAERFSAKTRNAEDAITLAQVEELMSVMGSAADLGGDTRESTSTEAPRKKLKKLYRDPDNRIIAGVASGLATYFGIDAVFVRIAFVLSLFVGGLGVLLYLILWLVTPEAETLSQKMEMQGDPVTLKNIEEAVKERLKKESGTKQPGGVTGFFNALFSGLGKTLRALSPVTRIFFGTIAVIVGAVAITGITTGFFGFIVHAGTPYIHPEVTRFLLLIPEMYLAPILGALFILAVVPMVCILLLGISLLKNSSAFSSFTATILLSLWAASIVITGVAASYLLPRFDSTIPEIRFYHYHHYDYDYERKLYRDILE